MTTNDDTRVNGVLCSNNGEVLRDAAVKGLGFTKLPTFIVGADLQNGRLVSVLSNYKSPSAFLTLLWRQGALMGAAPEQAFFVKCDEETNPQEEIDAGKVTREVVDGMRREMQQVRNDPNAVFFYAFVQARAIAF